MAPGTRKPTRSMREVDWASLVHSVRTGACILMLGPDAVAVQQGGVQVPVLEGLADFVKLKLGPDYDHLDSSKPSSVAQVAVDAEDPLVLKSWVQEFYDTSDVTSTVLDDLARLPFRLVINTFPGLGVGRAFQGVKPATVVDHYDRTAPNRPDIPEPTAEAPVVYDLYGTLQRPDSLVLSEEDRLDCLVSIITDSPQVPLKVRSALNDDTASLLFLGFSLDQWQFRLLLHVLANVRRRLWSFALELERDKLDVETSLFYERGKIRFPDAEPGAFTRELRQRVLAAESSAPGDADATAPLPPDAPVVFLCHASEDKAHAVRLGECLERNGIGVWLDEQSLRSGDAWDDRIESVIGSEADYVVVIQSGNLVRKQVGYVNKEIELARERQLHYRHPRRFLLPVTVDGPDHQVPELQAEFHAIDVASGDGADRLVREIKRDLDYARRGT